MNIWGWLILFAAIFVAIVGLVSAFMTIHTYFEYHQYPKIKQRPGTVSVLFIVCMFLLAIILTPVSFAVGKASSTGPSLNVKNQSPTESPTSPTSTALPQPTTPTPSMLYQVNFSQGNQGWLDSNHSQQWTYNDANKMLESDGSLPCCSQTTLVNVVLVAPYIVRVNDYAIEARIKITGLNSNYPYNSNQPPFFGLYVRGDDVNSQGYMAGIGWIFNTPTGKIGSEGPLSYLVALGPNPMFYNTDDKGAEKYGLDTAWHTYRIEVTGDTFMLKVDNKPVYSHPIRDNLFASGSRVGIENYNCLLQIQSFTVYPL